MNTKKFIFDNIKVIEVNREKRLQSLISLLKSLNEAKENLEDRIKKCEAEIIRVQNEQS